MTTTANLEQWTANFPTANADRATMTLMPMMTKLWMMKMPFCFFSGKKRQQVLSVKNHTDFFCF
jgi:hypothetical protein